MAGTDAAPAANADQIRYWNEIAGPRWVAKTAALDRQIGPIGERAMDRAGVRPGEAALDVGCGCGGSSLGLARRVGPGGFVLGIDVSEPMLGVAREAGLGRVDFTWADAQVHAFAPGAFDLVYSRFGVMFFEDPPAAFANLRLALRSGGRLCFVCWQALGRNPWMRVPLEAAARHLPLPEPPAPGAPGPFAFDDPDRVQRILTAAGFAGAELEPFDTQVALAGEGGVGAAIDLMLEIGPLGALLREAGPAARPAVIEALRDALAPYATPEGVHLPASAWLVYAAPGG